MSNIKELIASVQEEASREDFPIDEKVYESAGRNPLEPTLFFGDLKSKVCFFARDLGKDEVHAQQPLYGAAGRLVRKGLHSAIYGEQTSDKDKLEAAAKKVLLTNTVPYKPPGNKAYSAGVKKRFRPFLETLLLEHWQGDYIITLGNEAFKWFHPYATKKVADEFFKREDRYEAELEITISSKESELQKKVILAPLPHPSPLNQKYYHIFPDLLQNRLQKVQSFLK
ncbi:uracil-DNA glycosylase family protein [Candidatus Uabimicrobium sp. HlEnr_7]|uniref:uracil-DNA glycosylase family protein n=1 Tax=Candidatus Uabimicrobium helgolandensis TaxID=3095367 RepID=UPI0035583AFA